MDLQRQAWGEEFCGETWDQTNIEEHKDKRLQWFGHVERTEEHAWSSKCRKFKVNSSFPRTQPKNTWNEAIRSDLKQRKANKVKVKDKFQEVFRKKPLIPWKTH